MKLIFLGTSAGAPTRNRNVSGLVLLWPQKGKVWLFDCGEGTQHQFQRSSAKLSHMDRIFITHMHGDHVFGLPGLLASRSAAQNVQSDLKITGPGDLEQYLTTTLALTHTRIKYGWDVTTVQEGVVHEDDFCTVECRLLNHGIASFGYAITEKPGPGEFNAPMALELGVPSGPLYGVLKSGSDVTLEDGRVILAKELTGLPKKPRKVVICGDTGVTNATIELAAGADILVHEATFMADRTARALEVGHSTATQAAAAAKAAGVGHLILTHFSPRYNQDESTQMPAVLAEAQAIFCNTTLAEDFLAVDVPHGLSK
jgi:ribonuclease Z